MQTRPGVCINCARFFYWNPFGNKCEAFPDGIPSAELFERGNPHTEPIPGDGGKMFLSLDEVASPGPPAGWDLKKAAAEEARLE